MNVCEKTRWLPPMSGGKRDVQDALRAIGVQAIREKTFDGLVGCGGGLLRYDFAIPFSKGRFMLIEYDGVHHFYPSTWSDKITQEEAEMRFRVQKKTHDQIRQIRQG